MFGDGQQLSNLFWSQPVLLVGFHPELLTWDVKQPTNKQTVHAAPCVTLLTWTSSCPRKGFNPTSKENTENERIFIRYTTSSNICGRTAPLLKTCHVSWMETSLSYSSLWLKHTFQPFTETKDQSQFQTPRSAQGGRSTATRLYIRRVRSAKEYPLYILLYSSEMVVPPAHLFLCPIHGKTVQERLVLMLHQTRYVQNDH